jgi:hypothetical protein
MLNVVLEVVRFQSLWPMAWVIRVLTFKDGMQSVTKRNETKRISTLLGGVVLSPMTEERIRELEKVGFKNGRQVLGLNSLNNCKISKCSSVTASCHDITLLSRSSGNGFRISLKPTGCTMEESQIA